MRLNQLELVRYGKFTERRLDFGDMRPGEPDFHLVYGPNEAGKSTLFSGFLDLLFGIERLSPYGFLHPYQTMRVGGILEAGGCQHHAYRIKRNANSMIGPDEQPLPDNLFSAALGSIDRATYRMMFSLDDDSIEQGGESILKSEGELGSLLFSASSGLPDSGAALADLRAQADAFYRPQGRKHQLADLKAELDALKAERNAIDVNAREYSRLRKALANARERHDAAAGNRAELRVRRDRTRAQLDALPLFGRLHGVRRELAQQEPLPVPPAEWWSDLPILRKQEAEVAARLSQLREELRRRREELAELRRDEPALALAERFEAIRETALDARYLTAARDMPSRLGDLARTSAEIDACLARLGEAGNPDPASLLLPTALSARLQDLVRRHATLAERLASAHEEMESAKQAHHEAERDLARLKDGARDPGLLMKRLHLLRQSDCLLRQEMAAREIERLEAALSDKLDALRPFAGNVDDLATLAVPAPAGVDAWRAEEMAQAERRSRLDDRIADESERLAGDEARLAALGAHSGVADDALARELRRQRDLAWRTHRSRLDDVTASAFEAALKDDDDAAAFRLAQVERVAEMRGLALAISERRARLQVLEAQRTAAAEERGRLSAKVAAAAIACGLPDVTILPQLEVWLATRAISLELRADLRAACRKRDTAASEERSAIRDLQDELVRFGVADKLPDRLDGLLMAAEHVVSSGQAALVAHRAAVAQLHRAAEALESREAALASAEAAMAAWQEEWNAALGETWLAGRIERPLPHEIGSMLAVLQDFDKLMQRKAELEHRIVAMRSDQAAFVQAIASLAEALDHVDFGLKQPKTINVADAHRLERDASGIPPSTFLHPTAVVATPTVDPLLVFASLRDRIAAAEHSQERRLAIAASIERMEENLQSLLTEERLHIASKQVILDFFACGTLDEAGLSLDAAREQERLRERGIELENDLMARLGAGTIGEVEAMLAAVDDAELRLELARLDEAMDEADREVSELHAEVRNKERALAAVEGGDRVAELDQRRRTLLLDIESKAVGYLRLRAGVIAAEQALRLFRERHRSAMMQRASQTFVRISGGEYSGLSTQVDKGQEFLIAKAASGGSKLAGDLSKGTRFQLYLALRIAGYHEVAAARESLPFIADDIMETFDDGRAGRAFELMADMGRVGQVIYLTHHEHLCDLARSACPSVTIHRL
ncbi:AAA family ATPase [Sinorhizobium numidicum]|uniref:AAA family ATPase n=1 Tax=Sinorhizobium numidicum TaxID=680248 RepID=A0ABY8CXF4_9HYPH|nr:AAA family ATPase [Sinorhizobium numidicum]WEX78601.1 AAA family ATPase [Sinorhizobium numidicum]WEX81998.1 AAA family ATPase [Sinorhizobium numidicum]